MNIKDIKVGMILVGTKGKTIFHDDKVLVFNLYENNGVMRPEIKRMSNGNVACIPTEIYAEYYHQYNPTMKELLE